MEASIPDATSMPEYTGRGHCQIDTLIGYVRYTTGPQIGVPRPLRGRVWIRAQVHF
jgi:hypothetical protein